MRSLLILFIFVIPLHSYSQTNFNRLQELKKLDRISFGSCNIQWSPQPFWEDVMKQKPDLWIWGGDNIYADLEPGGSITDSYKLQNMHPFYKAFKQQIPFIGIWDDHDYAYDNADGNFSGKIESQKAHLDFMEIPEDAPVRSQEGIYRSYEFGEVNKKIKIILLDNRYFKNLDPEYPMLGKYQWDWFENELKNSKAKIHFIVSGLTVLSPNFPFAEDWAQTKDHDRLLNLLKKYQTKGVVFLTGDKHYSAIFKRKGYLEFMSSGLTHSATRALGLIMKPIFPKSYFGKSYGQIDITWEDENPILKLSMRTAVGKELNATNYEWNKEKWAKVRWPNVMPAL